MISRRAFARAAAGGIAGAGMNLRGAFRLNIGIGTYTYHGLPMDRMISELTALRIQEIEMSRGEFMLLSHPEDRIFRAAHAALGEAGIRCVSYYAATLKDEQDVENAVRFARLLGARNVTGDATGELLKKIDRRFAREGLTFGIHNHYFEHKFPYESPEDVLNALAGLSPAVGSSLDVGHIASCRHDPVDAVRKLGPYLKMVHLKDVKAAGGEVNVPLGQGVARIPEVMKELHNQNYRGLVAIEYEKEGPVEEDVRRQVEYARRLS
jgi:sugar phosphate isomerase/epimerase